MKTTNTKKREQSKKAYRHIHTHWITSNLIHGMLCELNSIKFSAKKKKKKTNVSIYLNIVCRYYVIYENAWKWKEYFVAHAKNKYALASLSLFWFCCCYVFLLSSGFWCLNTFFFLSLTKLYTIIFTWIVFLLCCCCMTMFIFTCLYDILKLTKKHFIFFILKLLFLFCKKKQLIVESEPFLLPHQK